MTKSEIESIYKRLNYCATGCGHYPVKCPECEFRVSIGDLFRLAKSHGYLTGALNALSGAMEIYIKE